MGYNTGMEFTAFKKHLASKAYAPCYLVAGDDAFVVRSACDMLRGLVEFPEFNWTLFHETASGQEIVEACEQLPVMGELRVVEVEGFKKDFAPIAKYLKNPSPTTILCLRFHGGYGSNIGAHAKLMTAVDCNRLTPEVVVRWIGAETARNNASISTAAASLLVRLCNADMTRVSAELKKLISATDGIIEEKLVSELVTPDNDFKIYELGEALAALDAPKTYEVYASLIVGLPPVSILGALYNHFRRLLYVSITADKSTLAASLGVKEYAVTMAARQAKRFSPKRLKSIVDNLNRYDRAFKSGEIGDREALDTFIAQTLVEGR